MAESMGSLIVDIRDGAGRAVELELLTRGNLVECRYRGQLKASFDRQQLQAWLRAPAGFIDAGEVTMTMTSHGDVAVSIGGVVVWWPLPGHVVEGMATKI